MKKVFLSLFVLATVSSSVFAGRIWHYTTISNEQHFGSALALRNVQAWPTIVTDYRAFVQTPVGWRSGPVDNQNLDVINGYVRAASHSNGSAAFIDGDTLFTVDSNGWNTHYFDTNSGHNFYLDVAYNSDGDLSVISDYGISTSNGSTWNQSSWINLEYGDMYSGIKGRSIVYDSYGQANVVGVDMYSQELCYGVMGSLTNNRWDFISLHVGSDSLTDLVLTSNDVPMIAYHDSEYQGLAVTTYDIQTNSWDKNFISHVNFTSIGSSFVMESDSQGGVGLAYIADHHVKFQYFDGEYWSAAETIGDFIGDGSIGLDFDFEDNPVISYTGTNPETGQIGLTIAYDPIITPEPLTLGMLSVGSLIIARRRR